MQTITSKTQLAIKTMSEKWSMILIRRQRLKQPMSITISLRSLLNSNSHHTITVSTHIYYGEQVTVPMTPS